MSRRSRILRSILRRWIDHFGEPPSILADPKLMLSILNSAPRQSNLPINKQAVDEGAVPKSTPPAHRR